MIFPFTKFFFMGGNTALQMRSEEPSKEAAVSGTAAAISAASAKECAEAAAADSVVEISALAATGGSTP